MRLGSVALLVTVALGCAAIAAAAGSAGVGTLDSAAMTPGPGLGRAFAGGAPDGTTDPDLPIRTARYGEDTPAAVLASVQPGADPRRSMAALPPVQLAGASGASVAPLSTFVATAPPAKRGLNVQIAAADPSDWLAGGPPETRSPDSRYPGARDSRTRAFNANPVAPQAPRAEKVLDGRALLVRIGPSQQDAKRGRWFVFAAGSGKAFGLNLIRDPVQGWRRAGWSVERLAEFGKVQLGLGWRKGPTQVSVAASRREIGAYGLSKNDTVVGLTFSIKPGK